MALPRSIRAALPNALGSGVVSPGLPWDSGGGGAAPAWTPASLGAARIIAWLDTTDAGNTVTAGEYETLADLNGGAKPFGTASSTVRPAQVTADMLNDINVAEGDGVDEWMRNTSTARPGTVALVYSQVTWGSGEPLSCFGSTNRPQLRQSGVSNRVDFLAVGAAISQPAVTFNDQYFRLVIGEDNGSTSQACYVYDPAFAALEGSDTDANTDARPANGQTLSLFASVTGTIPANARICFALFLTDTLTASEKTSLLEYLRLRFVDTGAASVMDFVGTKSTNANAQPRPYPADHEAVSGDTLASCAARLVGTWGGSGGTTIGSGDDPGAGNRGAMETLATTQGLTNLIALVMVGTNDASSGAISAVNYERFIRRLFAVAGVTAASNLKVLCAYITPRTDGAGVPQGRIDTFNDTDLPALISTLQGEGFAVGTWDPETGFLTGSMLQSDNLHPNKAGSEHVAQAAYDALAAGIGAGSLISASNRLVLIGDSITAGGSNLVPQAVAQYRPYLARLLAA